jgi:hypothetical protein
MFSVATLDDDTLVPVDPYAFGSHVMPREPRIEGYNLKPGQEPDIVVDANGMVGPTNPP